jgi:hypothetical protein
MAPGTTVPPHFHTRFAETFDLISGAITVYSSTDPDLEVLEASARPLEAGKEVTVHPKQYHKYMVSAEEPAVLRVTLTPGDANFERLLMIMNGLDADGELEKLGDSVLLMAVVMDLCNGNLIGPAKEMLEGVRLEKTAEIQALKDELLAKYDTKEALQALLGTAGNA